MNKLTKPLSPDETLATALEKIPAEHIARALQDALSATITSRAGTIEIDHRVRLSAAQMILDRVLGKPIERQQLMIAKVGGEADMIDRLAQSPAARQAIKDMLAAADAAGDVQTAV